MRTLLALIACFALAACDLGSREPGGLVTPPELKPKFDLAFACFQDTDIVPLQHSEHCVLMAEGYFEDRKKECEQSRSYDCLEYDLALNNIHSIYQMAIITSATNFGVADELSAAAKDTVAHFVYFDGELLRSLFEECLRKEQEALAEMGLKRVHSVMPSFLVEGQMCIREGSERFETAPL